MRWWRHGVCVEQRHAHLSGCGDPAQSKSASPREQPLFASDQQCILSCMFHRRWHVGLGFFFLSKFLKLVPSSTRLLQLSSRISRIGVNKRVFSPLLALVSLLRQGVVTCAAYLPFCFDTAVKVFLSIFWNRYCDRLFDKAVSIWLIYYRLCSF